MTSTIRAASSSTRSLDRLLRQALSPLRDLLQRPAVWMVGVQVVELCAQTIAGVLVARRLGSAAMGDFTYAFTIAAVLSVLLLFGTGDVAVSLYARREVSPAAILTASLRIWLRGALLCSVLGIAFVVAVDLGPRSTGAALLALLSLALNGLSSVLNQPIVALGKSRKDFPLVCASRALLLTLLWFATDVRSLLLALSAYSLAAFGLVGMRAWLVHTSMFPLRLQRDPEVDAVLWTRGRHVGTGAVFGSLSARADMLLLRTLTTAEQAGLYGASYRIINGLDAVAMSVANGLFPEIARLVGQGQHAQARRVCQRATIAFAAGVLLLVPFSGVLLGLIFGPEFAHAGIMFAVLLIACALQVAILFFHKWCIATGRERVLPGGQGVAAVVNLGANALLIPAFGALGAALSTLLSELALVAYYAARFVYARPVESQAE